MSKKEAVGRQKTVVATWFSRKQSVWRIKRLDQWENWRRKTILLESGKKNNIMLNLFVLTLWVQMPREGGGKRAKFRKKKENTTTKEEV